jgi:hypothetical protein
MRNRIARHSDIIVEIVLENLALGVRPNRFYRRHVPVRDGPEERTLEYKILARLGFGIVGE